VKDIGNKRPPMKPTLTSLIASASLCLPLHATGSSSADFSIAAETTDSGGCRSTSANYSNDGSAGLVAGVSTAATETAKAGYIAQLFDVTGLVIAAASTDMNETGTLQLSASQLLDDASLLAVDAGAVAWSLVSGPITGVSSSGLVTAGAVYQKTAAVVSGSFATFSASLALNVLDTIPDNYGMYAGDGLSDNWQVQYFGSNNPKAGPTVDADGSGQNNLFKWIAGLNPVDGSRFTAAASPIPGQPGKMWFSFSPLVAGRTYTVEKNDTLLPGAWHALTGFSQSDSGTTRTVTDNTAPGTHRFYRVLIGMP